MTSDLTLVGALGTAIATLAGAVAVLWKDARDQRKALEARTDSHLSVATKQMEVLALMGVRLEGVERRLDVLDSSGETRISELIKRLESWHDADQLQHSGQLKALATIEALLLPRMEPIRKRDE